MDKSPRYKQIHPEAEDADALYPASGPEPSREGVWRMFDRIAPRYDLLNRLLSGRLDVLWRARLARALPEGDALALLDVATGTGDALIALHQATGRIALGVGLDMAGAMLARAQRKIRGRCCLELQVMRGDAMRLALAPDSFDAVTIAFGIRNVTNVDVALREMARVLKPGGRLLVLEFSLPANRLVRRFYLFYLRRVVPLLGGLISGDTHAYQYLNTTIETFPYGEAFCRRLRACGLDNVRAFPLTLGIATLYVGDRTMNY